jgi:hypothetical protein
MPFARPHTSFLVLCLLAAACSSSSSTGTTVDAGKDAPASHDTGTHDAITGLEAALKDAPAKDVSTPETSTPETSAPTDAPPDVAIDAGGPSDAGKPPPPSGDAAPASAPINFAIHHLWLGDSDPTPAFTADSSAWASFGYNIDGLITNENSTDVCTLNTAAGAKATIQVDGVNGIDNSFGKNVVTVLATAITNLSKTVTSSILDGSFTILIDTNGLTPSATQTNTGLTGSLFSGASYGGAPQVADTDAGAFLVTDDWPVASSSLAGSLDAGASIMFPSAYVSNGLWVSGAPVDLTLLLSLQGQPLVLHIHQAILSFTHTVDASGQDHATGGMIAGVLKTTEFLQEINIVAAQQDYCAAAGLLLNYMQAASDILHDGTNVAGQPCDGISIGLAFDADGIAQPDKVVQSVDAGPPPAGCVADAGG